MIRDFLGHKHVKTTEIYVVGADLDELFDAVNRTFGANGTATIR